MIDYDRDQQQKSAQAEAMFELKLAGLTDGSHGHPLDVKHMHDKAYLQHYVIGLTQWVEELERREAENFVNQQMEF